MGLVPPAVFSLITVHVCMLLVRSFLRQPLCVTCCHAARSWCYWLLLCAMTWTMMATQTAFTCTHKLTWHKGTMTNQVGLSCKSACLQLLHTRLIAPAGELGLQCDDPVGLRQRSRLTFPSNS